MTDKQNYFTYTDNTSDSNDKTMENLHKQIIIDGVDVSGCENLMQGIVPFGCMEDRKTCSCMNNPNCLYKQLKRKEQENKDLREDIKDIARLLDLDTGEEYNFANIESAIKNYCADCDVAERMRKVTYAVTGGRLSYANYTVEAIEQAYNDQLRIDVEYRTKELEEQLDQLKAENRELKAVHSCNVALSDELFKYKAENDKLKEARKNSRCAWKSLEDTLCPEAQEQLDKLKQTLTEIKSILELYANSKVGEEQPDGTYQLSSGIGGSFGFGFGVCITTYDPRPARQALQKISEVEE